MMPELDQIYDTAFFKEWGPSHTRYIESAEIITGILFNEFKPRRLVDLGCGCGIYSHLFQQKGAEVLSIDGVQPPHEHTFISSIHVQDLTAPFINQWGSFDMALCLEVAEHIPEPLADSFLKNITQFSDRLILSAAPPNQGGHHHVNEQPKRYWVKRLVDMGFVYQRKATGHLMETFKKNKPGFMWMCEHISVYEKKDVSNIRLTTLPFHQPQQAQSR